MIYANILVLQTVMLHTKFQGNWTSGSGKVLKGFEHFWAWQPSWSCDLDHLCKLLFPFPSEASNEIWLWLAKRFRRRSLKLFTTTTMTTTMRTPEHGYTISLPCEPDGLGELKIALWSTQSSLKDCFGLANHVIDNSDRLTHTEETETGKGKQKYF